MMSWTKINFIIFFIFYFVVWNYTPPSGAEVSNFCLPIKLVLSSLNKIFKKRSLRIHLPDGKIGLMVVVKNATVAASFAFAFNTKLIVPTPGDHVCNCA